MRKKKLIAFSGLFLLLIAAGVFLYHPAPGPQVVGGYISAKDLAEVKHLAHRQLWSGVFPDFSWKSIKGLPGSINSRWHTHLSDIWVVTNGFVEVTFVEPGLGSHFYMLNKGPKSWKLVEEATLFH